MRLPIYIDVHRHGAPAAGGHEDTGSIYNKQDRFSRLPPGGWYSTGIHPWFINDLDEQLASLRQAATHARVLAIGECGLDALCGRPMEQQAMAFEQQIRLANDIGKPLLLHCVRAFPQALQLLKRAHVPVIFHGFNKRATIAREILKEGYYLSFGADLLKEKSAAYSVFPAVPPHRFFLETDNSPVAITTIYNEAARIRKTAEDVIILQVRENFKLVFNL